MGWLLRAAQTILTTAGPNVMPVMELAPPCQPLFQHRGVAALRPFAASLRHDAAAVRAVLESVWSNGSREGQITRLQVIERIGSGHAKRALLRQRPVLRLMSPVSRGQAHRPVKLPAAA